MKCHWQGPGPGACSPVARGRGGGGRGQQEGAWALMCSFSLPARPPLFSLLSARQLWDCQPEHVGCSLASSQWRAGNL